MVIVSLTPIVDVKDSDHDNNTFFYRQSENNINNNNNKWITLL